MILWNKTSKRHYSGAKNLQQMMPLLPRTQKMVRDVFKDGKYPLDLWIAGHTHVYKRVEAHSQWQFPVVIVSGGGPRAELRPGIALHFEVKPGKIVMKALNTDGTIHDTFELKK